VVAAAVRRIRENVPPYAPVRVAIEGTTYMIYKGMRRAMNAWLHVMLTRGSPCPYVISPVEQASLFGAAVAALSDSH
jgi:hexokinase